MTIKLVVISPNGVEMHNDEGKMKYYANGAIIGVKTREEADKVMKESYGNIIEQSSNQTVEDLKVANATQQALHAKNSQLDARIHTLTAELESTKAELEKVRNSNKVLVEEVEEFAKELESTKAELEKVQKMRQVNR